MAQQQQHGKSQRQFKTLFTKAFSHGSRMTEEVRKASTETFLKAVHAAPSVWTKHRFFAFSTFLVGINNDSMTQSHVDLIKKDFIDNEDEPSHFRVFAAFYVASCWYTRAGSAQMNWNIAAELYREGLDSIATSPQEDEKRKVLHHPYVDLHVGDDQQPQVHPKELTLKGVLCLLEEAIRKSLSQVQQPIGRPKTMFPGLEAQQLKRLDERCRPGGLGCDCCGKTLVALQLPSLNRCSRCEMVFYCTEKCQREHWKHKGHKIPCRAKGQIEIGDDVLLIDKTDKTKVAFVKVITRVGNTNNTWQVRHFGLNGLLVTVDGADLMRLRPPPSTL